MLVVDNDSYYLSIGRDAASTIETLSVNEKVIEWIKETELRTNNQECKSIFSFSTTNEEMLNYVYGYKSSSHKSERHRILSDSILDSRIKTGYYKSEHFINKSDTITEENIELSHINTDLVLPAVKASNTETIIQENASSHPSIVPSHFMQGQYTDYHNAVDLTADSRHGSIASPAPDFNSVITEATDSVSVLTYSPSDENYVDHDIAFSMDSAMQSVDTNVINHAASLSIPPQLQISNALHPLLGYISHTILQLTMMMLLWRVHMVYSRFDLTAT